MLMYSFEKIMVENETIERSNFVLRNTYPKYSIHIENTIFDHKKLCSLIETYKPYFVSLIDCHHLSKKQISDILSALSKDDELTSLALDIPLLGLEKKLAHILREMKNTILIVIGHYKVNNVHQIINKERWYDMLEGSNNVEEISHMDYAKKML